MSKKPRVRKKVPAIFRCPTKDCQEMEAVCEANNIEFSRYILSALLMYTDACEAEGIIPSAKDGAAADPAVGRPRGAAGNGGKAPCDPVDE